MTVRNVNFWKLCFLFRFIDKTCILLKMQKIGQRADGRTGI